MTIGNYNLEGQCPAQIPLKSAALQIDRHSRVRFVAIRSFSQSSYSSILLRHRRSSPVVAVSRHCQTRLATISRS